MRDRRSFPSTLACSLCAIAMLRAGDPAQPVITEGADQILISTSTLEAGIRKRGYVSGVYRQTFLDKKTGFRDPGFGLDIVDWLMESGTDAPYRDQLPPDLQYRVGDLYHGNIHKRSIEGPQICTKAKELSPEIIRGDGFVTVKMGFRYSLAAPGKKPGSSWNQTIVFPAGKRYFISCDKITSANDSDGLFLRIDMPGHVRHKRGNTFSEIYLSYIGHLPPTEFFEDFPPDKKFLYRRGETRMPGRFIRAYRLRDPETGAPGPWLAGMTLDPGIVSEAWCHQRNYICMIEEFGGFPIRAGQSFSAAFIVGYFDSIEEMEKVYDQHAGARELVVDNGRWELPKATR